MSSSNVHQKKKQQQQEEQESDVAKAWNIQASYGALNTSNPIREIIETMNLAENPNKKVIPLSIGDPTIFGNLKPCNAILDALHKANACGKYYGYQTAAGMESAREAVAEYHYKCTGNKVKRQDVILASGCSHAIDLCICVLARPGQNILIPRPGFPLYKTLTSVYGVHYKQYNLLAEQNWSIDLKHLESLIDENTAAIVVNNPSNPCGSVFSRNHLLEVLELAERYKKPIIADEIYDKFVFGQKLYNRRPKLHNCSKSNQAKSKNRSQIRCASEQFECENRLPAQIGSANNNHDTHKMFIDTNSSGENGRSESDEAYEDFVDIDQDVAAIRDQAEKNCEEDSKAEIGVDEDDLVEGQTDEEEDEEEEHYDFENEEESIDGEISHVPFKALSSLSKTVPILTCGGISKTCLIPGLRLGWIIINDRRKIFDVSVRTGLNRLTQRLMGPNSLVQGALQEILTNVPETFYSQTMDFIFKNAKLCYDRLRVVKGLQPHMPQGSMYMMVKFDAKGFPNIDGDLDFTSKLMNEESVLVLPGKCFDFPNYFRLCLTVPTNVMEEALERMKEFCERHYVNYQLNAATKIASLVSKANFNVQNITTTNQSSCRISW